MCIRDSPTERLLPADADERLAIARRVVADRCLYGVDINPMAVEMAKLSMWLITVDKNRPFTFLDHAFKCGDSLLGMTSLDQLENFSLRPGGGKQRAFATLNLWRHIDEAKKKRETLEMMPSDTPEQIAAKAALYAEAEQVVAKLGAAADVLVAVELKGLKGQAYDAARETSSDNVMNYWAKGVAPLNEYAAQQMRGRRCLHWAIEFPEIVGGHGFDAFVGNPPFMGGRKISTNIGSDYLEYLLSTQDRVSGIADLVCHFFRRCFLLASDYGVIGMISTNSVAEVDSRRSSLDPITQDGGKIYRAQHSTTWPGQAAVVISIIHIAKQWLGQCILDDKPVREISTSLVSLEKNERAPVAIVANSHLGHSGSKIMGDGFKLNASERLALLKEDANSGELIRHLLGGSDVTEKATVFPSRFVIDPGQLDEAEVQKFPAIYSRLKRLVFPNRSVIKDVAKKKYWWRFAGPSNALYRSIEGRDKCLVCCRVAKYVMFDIVETHSSLGPLVFDESVVVVALDGDDCFSILQSTFHSLWVDQWGSKMGTAPRYTATEVLETFPFPANRVGLFEMGSQYRRVRQTCKERTGDGLTGVYNRLHSPNEVDECILRLRQLHADLDNAVAAAYGWQDLDLGHSLHETKQGIRFTISEAARREVLDRMLALNHQRQAEESAAGICQKSTSNNLKATRRAALSVADGQNDLFDQSVEAEAALLQVPTQIHSPIFEFLATNPGWHSKDEILKATGFPNNRWTVAIRELLDSGQVNRHGEKRGAKYRFAGTQD